MDGILLVDKPSGMTSHDAVMKVRQLLGEARIGHTGTLDPMASGLLVLCLGRATKLVARLTEHDKTYEAEATLGIATDTDDATGRITARVAVDDLPEDRIDAALQSFQGDSTQVPPAYAAIKVEGRKLYEYARKGMPVPVVEPRPIRVDAIARTSPAVAVDGKLVFTFAVSVSKGTYVRALVRDLGSRLGCPATLSALRRVRVDRFTLAEAATLAEIAAGNVRLIDPLDVLGLPSVQLDEPLSFQAKNGGFLPLTVFPETVPTLVFDSRGKALAIYRHDAERNVMRLEVML